MANPSEVSPEETFSEIALNMDLNLGFFSCCLIMTSKLLNKGSPKHAGGHLAGENGNILAVQPPSNFKGKQSAFSSYPLLLRLWSFLSFVGASASAACES